MSWHSMLAGILALSGCSIDTVLPGQSLGSDGATADSGARDVGRDVSVVDTPMPPRDVAGERQPDAMGDTPTDVRPDRPVTGMAPCPDNRDLILCLPFEGTAEDESPRAHSVSRSSPPAFAPGRFGQGLRSQSGLRLLVPTEGWPEFTVETWVNLAALPEDEARYAILDKNGGMSFFIRSDGTIRCWAGQEVIVGTDRELVGGWHHLACVRSANAVRVYVDGVRRGEEMDDLELRDAGNPWHVLHNHPALDLLAEDPLIGVVDRFRIWSLPLSETQICRAASAGPC